LATDDLGSLKAVLDGCEVNVRDDAQTAPAFNECRDELARWLVESRV
jgi:hypothetical protein